MLAFYANDLCHSLANYQSFCDHNVGKFWRTCMMEYLRELAQSQVSGLRVNTDSVPSNISY